MLWVPCVYCIRGVLFIGVHVLLSFRFVCYALLEGIDHARVHTLQDTHICYLPTKHPFPTCTQGVYSPQPPTPSAPEDLTDEDWEAMARDDWHEDERRAVLADLPGLIQGAHVV